MIKIFHHKNVGLMIIWKFLKVGRENQWRNLKKKQNIKKLPTYLRFFRWLLGRLPSADRFQWKPTMYHYKHSWRARFCAVWSRSRDRFWGGGHEHLSVLWGRFLLPFLPLAHSHFKWVCSGIKLVFPGIRKGKKCPFGWSWNQCRCYKR